MRKIHSRTQNNGGEISLGKLCCGGPGGTIVVDLSATRDKGYRTGVRRAGKVLWENLLPCLFFGKSKTLPPIVGALSKLPVKKARPGLHNTMT